MAIQKNGIIVLGAVFVDIKGFPEGAYIPDGRNAGKVKYVHGGVSRNVVEDIANIELRPTYLGIVDESALGEDVLRKLDVTPIRADITEREAASKRSTILSPTIKWELNREIVGSLMANKSKVDGIILLSAFPCGPDSMIDEMIQRRMKGVPILTLTLDAQSGTAGVETRLESFVDIIHFKEGTL